MGETRTVPVTRWSPTRYGLLVAFMGANRAECKTAEDRQHAHEVVKKLAAPYQSAKRDFAVLAKADFTDERFPAMLDEFDEVTPAPVIFTRSCWTWLKGILHAAVDPGCFAALRVRVDKSVDDAKNEDAPLAE